MRVPQKKAGLIAAVGLGGLLLAGCATYPGYGGYGDRAYAPYSSHYGAGYRSGYGDGAHRGGYVGGGFGVFSGGHGGGTYGRH